MVAAQFFRCLFFGGPIVVLFLLAKGLTLPQVLALSSALLISGIIFEIPTGVFADRYGRKWSMVMGSLASVIGYSLWLFANNFIGFIAIHVIFGLANAFWSGADQALIYDDLKARGKQGDAQKIFSRYDAITSAAFAVAALVGGMLTIKHDLAHYYPVFYLTLAASVVGLLLSFSIRESRHSTEAKEIIKREPDAVTRFGVGFKLLRENPKLLRIVAFSVLTVSFALGDLSQPYFVQAHVPTIWYGIELALATGLGVLLSLYAFKLEQWFGVEKAALIIAVVPGVFWLLMAYTFGPLGAILLVLLGDAWGSFRSPILSDYQNRHITGPQRATALSTFSLINSAYVAFMLPVIGLLAQHSLSWAFLLMGGLILVATALFRIRSNDVVVAS
jgi:MFS family permease